MIDGWQMPATCTDLNSAVSAATCYMVRLATESPWENIAELLQKAPVVSGAIILDYPTDAVDDEGA